MLSGSVYIPLARSTAYRRGDRPMSNRPHPEIDAVPDERDPDADTAAAIQHVTLEDGDVAVCTMFPADGASGSRDTAWLTATDDAFVALEDAR